MWYMLIAYMFHTTAVIVLNTIYTLTGCVLLTLMITITLMCNEDEAVFGEKSDYLSQVPDDKTFCYYCRATVAKSARHCAVCDKCVVGFDHHCRWLNTCIGAKNYRYFVAFVTIVFSAVTFQGVVSLFVFISCLVDSAFYKERLRIAYGTACIPAYLVFLGISIFFLGVAVCASGDLLLFHIYLRFEGISTYEYVKRKRQRELEAEIAAEEVRAGKRAPPPGCCVETKRRDFKKEAAARGGAAAVAPSEPIHDEPSEPDHTDSH